MERCVGVLARYPVAVLQPLQLPQVANQPKQAQAVRVDAAIAFANDSHLWCIAAARMTLFF